MVDLAIFYPTSDTPLACYLITSGFNLEAIDYSGPRYQFIFKRSPEIQGHANLYISGKALTDPADFARVNKKLLRIISRRIQWDED
jgi:hypothetical protein